MNLNLPSAWLLSCCPEDIETNDRTLLIPSLPGVNVADVIFIGDSINGRVYSETVVKSVDNSNIELLITASVDEHPLLDYTSLVSRGIIPSNLYGGYEKLTNQAFIFLRTIFRDPSHY